MSFNSDDFGAFVPTHYLEEIRGDMPPYFFVRFGPKLIVNMVKVKAIVQSNTAVFLFYSENHFEKLEGEQVAVFNHWISTITFDAVAFYYRSQPKETPE